jgi:hypothetical protein
MSPDEQAKVNEMFEEAKRNTDALAAAVGANTPADDVDPNEPGAP